MLSNSSDLLTTVMYKDQFKNNNLSYFLTDALPSGT